MPFLTSNNGIKLRIFAPTVATTLVLGSLALPISVIPPVQAQVSISPLTIEVQAKRGQAQGLITVGNSSNEAFRARVYAEPFTYNQDAGFQTLASSPNDLRPYLQFSPTELVVPPGVDRRVRFVARFPPNLPDGEYRAVIFTQNLKETFSTDGSGNKIGITTRIGVTVYVRIGDVKPELKVENVSFIPQKDQMQLKVSNTGKASVGSTVLWSLKQGEKTVATGKLNSSWIMAESGRNLLLPFPDKERPAAGNYQFSGNLQWGKDENPSTIPFNFNLAIPAKTTTK